MTSHNKTQPNVQVKIGVLADRPVAGQVNPGTISYTTDSPPSIDVADATTGIRAWLPLAGSGGNTIYPKYWVAKNVIAPFAPYTTIQSAIDAAAADGHSTSNRAAVYVTPGTYTEAVTMKDGIDLIGMSSSGGMEQSNLGSGGTQNTMIPDVRISGSLALDAGFTIGEIRCIRVTGTAGASAVSVSGATAQFFLQIRQCEFQVNFATGATLSGTLGNTASQVILEDCQINNSSAVGTAQCINFTNALNWSMFNVTLATFAATDTCLVRNGGALFANGCNFFGNISYGAASTDKFTNCFMTATGATGIVTFAGVTVTWSGGYIAGATAGALFSGAGTVTFQDNFVMPKYWVAPANYQPAAPFTSIQTAINQSVTDGHSSTNRCAVVIMPGVYTENITLADGVNLVGMEGSFERGISGGQFAGDLIWSAAGVNITGTISDGTMTSGCNVSHLKFGTTAQALQLNAATGGYFLSLHHCKIQTNAALTSIIGGAPAGGPILSMAHCQLLNQHATGTGIVFTTAVDVNMDSCSIALADSSKVGMSFTGGVHTIVNTKIAGNIAYASQSTGDHYQGVDLSTATVAAITFAGAATTLTWTGGSIIGALAGTTFSGTGTVTLINVQVDSNAVTVPSTVTCTTSGILRAFIVSAIGAADKVVTNVDADLYTFNTQAATRTLTLPAANTVPVGTQICVAMGAGNATNAITVAPNGTNTIAGTNASVLTSAGNLFAGMILKSISNTGWAVLSRS